MATEKILKFVLKNLFWSMRSCMSRILYLLRSAVAGRIYKLCAKHTSNSGFDRTFMPCSGYYLCAAKQRAGYQISWVDLQREANCS